MQHTKPSSQRWDFCRPGSETKSASVDARQAAPSGEAPPLAGTVKNLGAGAGLAMSVAALFVAACQQRDGRDTPSPAAESTSAKSMPAPPDPKSGNVQCLGIHECKGKSACHVIGSHACAGLNTCKGKGWIAVPTAECQSKGGKVLDS
jgi:hypothetical protein